MDPPSAIVGIVSFGFTVFGKVKEVRKAIKGASEDLQSLHDSCDLIELSLEQLRTVSALGSFEAEDTRLENLCDKAQRYLRDVEVLVEKVTVTGNGKSGGPPIRRIKWLMKKDNINDIARKLRELQITLALMVIMMQS